MYYRIKKKSRKKSASVPETLSYGGMYYNQRTTIFLENGCSP